MSGSSPSSRPPGFWQPGQEYWFYLPANASEFLAARTTQNLRGRTRDPWLLLEDSFLEPYNNLASFPQVSPLRPSHPLLLIDDTRPRARQAWPDTPTYFQPASTREEESRLSPEEQKQAVNKLRKRLYSPHINNIIRRLGTKYHTSNPGESFQEDESKRCAVCLEDFESKQFVTVTPCDHMFHEECIVPWIKSQGKCPVCRFMIAGKSPPRHSRNDGISRLAWSS